MDKPFDSVAALAELNEWNFRRQARIEELEKELVTEKAKSAHYAQEAATRSRALAAYIADGIYTDENQTTWTRPTAYVYAKVCNAKNKLEAQLAEARERNEWMLANCEIVWAGRLRNGEPVYFEDFAAIDAARAQEGKG